MTNELGRIIDEGVANGADPRFVAEIRSVFEAAKQDLAQEQVRVAKLPELTDERRAAIAARRAARADRLKGTGWKY